jgi:hypothetical protein
MKLYHHNMAFFSQKSAFSYAQKLVSVISDADCCLSNSKPNFRLAAHLLVAYFQDLVKCCNTIAAYEDPKLSSEQAVLK